MVETQQALQRKFIGGLLRWTPVEQIHLTLRFLGDVPEESVPKLGEALRRAVAPTVPFELFATGLGCFPDARRPRVLWAGVNGDLDALNALQQRVANETVTWGHREDRAFHAHLTLGRIKDGVGREASRLGVVFAEEAHQDFGRSQVSAVTLMRSELSPGGAQHSVVAEFKM